MQDIDYALWCSKNANHYYYVVSGAVPQTTFFDYSDSLSENADLSLWWYPQTAL